MRRQTTGLVIGLLGVGEDRLDEGAPKRCEPGEEPSEDTMGRSAAARQTAADQLMEAPMLKTNDLSRSVTPFKQGNTPHCGYRDESIELARWGNRAGHGTAPAEETGR